MPVKGCKGTVLQTNTGGRVEYTKVIERTILKELGKTAGRKLARCPSRAVMRGTQQKPLSDCLSKTQVPAKSKDDV